MPLKLDRATNAGMVHVLPLPHCNSTFTRPIDGKRRCNACAADARITQLTGYDVPSNLIWGNLVNSPAPLLVALRESGTIGSRKLANDVGNRLVAPEPVAGRRYRG